MRRLALVLLCVPACGGGLAPPGGGSTGPVTGAGFIGVQAAHGTTAVTVAIDRQARRVDALFAPATCTAQPMGPMPITSGFLSAGTITVSDEATTVLLPQLDGSYPFPGASSSTDLAFGDTLTVAATGGDIPAFMTSLAAPTTLTVSMPDPRNAPGMVDGKKDLVLAWDPQPGATVEAALFGNDQVLACDFAGELGGGKLPGAELAKLGSTDANLVVNVSSSTTVTSGAVPIDVRATLEALDELGKPYLYAFMLQ